MDIRVTMDWWLLGFILGAILSLFLPIVPVLFYVSLFLGIGFLLFSITRLRRFSGIFLAISWLLFHGYQYNNAIAINKLDPKEVYHQVSEVRGVVSSMIANNDGPLSFNFSVKKFNQHMLKQPLLVRLRWRHRQFSVQQGDVLSLSVKLKPAHGLANEAEFSYQTWLRQHTIIATGYVLNKQLSHKLLAKPSFRQRYYQQLSSVLVSQPMQGILLALSMGERSSLTHSQWQVLTATGTQHLVAISGLHLGLIASASFVLLSLASRLFPCQLLVRRLPVNTLQSVNIWLLIILLSVLCTLLYAALAGFAIPTIRALLMLALYWAARIAKVQFSLTRWLLLSVFFMLLVDPMMLISNSFWLSLIAVLCIVLIGWLYAAKLRNLSSWRRLLSMYLLIQLGLALLLLPLSALAFQRVAIIAMCANLIAVPWLSLVVLPFTMLGSLSVLLGLSSASMFYSLADRAMQLLWQYLVYLAHLPWASVALSQAQVVGISIVVPMILALAVLYKLYPQRLAVWGVLCGVSLVFTGWLGDREDGHNWQLYVFDVGNGSAMVLEKNHHVIIYDVGAKLSSGFNIADAVLIPFLRAHGTHTIDYLILSHDDNDHAGSAPILLDSMPVQQLVANFNIASIPEISAQPCLAAQSISWQGLTLSQLWPVIRRGANNDDSCVVRITDGQHSVLFTGDISKHAEQHIINSQQLVQADVLIVPHHGSKYSSSAAFIANVQPQWAIVSSGFYNQWHMPATATLLRYQQAGVIIHNTAEEGMIKVSFTQQQINVQGYRQNFWPYWFAN